MLQNRSVVAVADNSGALRVRVFWLRGTGASTRGPRSFGVLGDVRTASVLEARSDAKVKKGDVVHVLLVRTAGWHRGVSGVSLRFGRSACILVTPAGKGHVGSPWVPVGTRLQGPIPRVLRQRGYAQVLARSEVAV